MIDRLSPLGATGSTALASAVQPAGVQRPAEASLDFGAVLGRLVTDAADVLRSAEAASIAGVKGQVPVQQVVERVLAAEQTLQAAIAIRDKVTGAYLELSRMAI